MTTIRMEQAYRLARVRQDRDALMSAARRRMQSAGRGGGLTSAVVLERLPRALARHQVFVARDLNRRLIALKRAPASPPEGDGAE
jgi:hypothetical protein